MTHTSSRRYLALWLPYLETDRIEQSLTGAPERAKPRATIEPVKGALRLRALNPAALRANLTPGLALADARARLPDLIVHTAEPKADACLLERLCAGALRYTPLAALDPSDGLMLDITGCSHLFGGERAMGQRIKQGLYAQGFAASIAIAPSPAAAWGLAHHRPGSIVTTETLEDALKPLPIAALRLHADTLDGLSQAGLLTIADLIARPRAPLSARFGTRLLERLDEARALTQSPISPRLPIAPFIAERRFAEPIVTEEAVLALVPHLMGELGSRMAARGLGARALRLDLFRADGAVRMIPLGLSAPAQDAQRLQRLFKEKLAYAREPLDIGFGFDLVRLSVVATGTLEPAQTAMLNPILEAETQDPSLATALDSLTARYDAAALARFTLQDSHLPERALKRTAPLDPLPRPAASPLPAEMQDCAGPTRPLRLLPRPEPVSAIAAIPDGPPRQFLWRRRRYDVMRAEGPERIAPEWWRPEDEACLTRDYFRIEDKTGARFWLFREGLYERETTEPRWFVHGLFG